MGVRQQQSQCSCNQIAPFPLMTDHKTVPQPTNELFELTMLHCIFERVSSRILSLYSIILTSSQKYSQSHETATSSQLEALKYSGDDESAVRPAEASTSPDATENDPFKDVPVLLRSPAELYLFDTASDMFVLQEKDVQVDLAANAQYDSESYSR